jgi:hypothetical protein
MLLAQQVTTSLRGVVTDNSGAVIPGVPITLLGEGSAKTAKTQADGSYSFVGLAAGEYTLKAVYPGFVSIEKAVTIESGKTLQYPIQMMVSAGKQDVTVQGGAASGVSTEADANASALVIKGTDLDSLPDNPDDLSDMLQALAGPAAGPNGGQLSVDGFSGAKLPPKASIREIRINQNPFSAEYDRIGFGRIDIFTKPGTEKLRGSIGVNDSDAIFNSRNPYAANKADYSNLQFTGNVSGSLSKRSSVFLTFDRSRNNNNALITAETLNEATLAQIPVRLSVLTPRMDLNASARLDYQLSTNHTLIGRFNVYRSNQDNNGIGKYSLLSRAYSSENDGYELQFTETAILNPTTVNETRLSYSRNTSNQYGNNLIPTINVSEAFSSGGAQVGRASNLFNRFELQNYTSIARGVHTFRFGGRARRVSLSDTSPANFGGAFTFFGVGNVPELDGNNQPIPGQTTQISSLEQYRRTLLFQRLGYSAAQIRAVGGGASQFTISGGNPLAEVSQFDIGLFAQDDWKIKPNFTLSTGFRYETQTNISDLRDFAPRIAIAWAPKAKPGAQQTTVIRSGIGLYYDRVAENLTLRQSRFNGVNQQQFLLINPDFFPTVPSLSSLEAQRQPVNTYKLEDNIRTPMMMIYGIMLEQQLPKKTTASITYGNIRQTHVLRSVNINSPLPGTFYPAQPGSGLRPYGSALGNEFLYESSGLMNLNILFMSVNSRFSQKVTLGMGAAFLRAKSDVDGLSSPSDPYNFRLDYGRAGFARRYNANVFGSINAPLKIQINPMLVMSAGAPYDLTSGHDLNGDTIANDRPAFATDLTRTSVVKTRFGAFDTNPLPGQTIVPRNYLMADRMWNINARVSRTFQFGKPKAAAAPGPGRPGGGGEERRYSINFNVFANNVLNHLNHGGFIGNLSSPLFGQSTSINLFRETSNNRRIQLGTQFNF